MMLTLAIEQLESRVEHEAMNCVFAFILEGAEPAYLAQAAQAAANHVDDLESVLSLYREGSDVFRINAAAAGETLHVAEETAECLALAMRMAADTQGAFHPFCGAEAMRAKDQDAPFAMSPQGASGEPVIELDATGGIVRKRRTGSLLDLGGIGKGYALDSAARLLQDDWEIPSGLLVAGGSSLLAFGERADGSWPVRDEDGLELPGLAHAGLASSGLGFQPDHIIDPVSARPVAHRRCVWVHAPSAAAADALATAAMVLPEKMLFSLFPTLNGVSLLFQDNGRSESIGPYFSSSTI